MAAVVGLNTTTTLQTNGSGTTPNGQANSESRPKKKLLLNAFDMNGIGHTSHGQWRNPVDRTKTKNRLDYWINLAKLLDSGRFNALFLADNFGSHDVYGGTHAPAIRAGSQWPLYDPFVIISAMAAVTENLAFGITSCTTFEPPYLLAKRFSTLDHVTNGRIAWNIVTSWSDNAARAVGLEKLPDKDTRYEMADEYLELMYKLWEGSWADDAVVQDEEIPIYSDPDKVRKIEHHGKFFNCVSAHQVDPSPQRTPVLFQAGMSPAGIAFAAKHAECIFVGGPTPEYVGAKIKATRQLAKEFGRQPSDLKFFLGMTPVLGATDEEARQKLASHLQYHDPEGSLAQNSGIGGFDLSKFPLDEEFPTDPDHSLLKGLDHRVVVQLTTKPRGYENSKWTPREFSKKLAIGGASVSVVGSSRTVADEMERWVNEADVDGFNLGHVVVPQAWEDVIEYLLPELERRGLFDGPSVGHGATVRENVYGTPGNAKLRTGHPGRKWAFDVYPDGHGKVVGREKVYESVPEAEAELEPRPEVKGPTEA
ncbi:hypothetical protein A1O3_00950 [Capronia epimyces CBS 606.96]|uniref:Luciferase-like domain-containing protein n=1 Tax=Capronia epimyces CBS 606.96 TaxID=1182542 RepID=W9YRY5_9EURO|nr:uncharacterized protein A1O3_00950 [Capronia epimyces CBS 606.96]EXJ92400.1 hypothetical protein A1O3_00950 [Capronia epimyces CBS 606.96]